MINKTGILFRSVISVYILKAEVVKMKSFIDHVVNIILLVLNDFRNLNIDSIPT